MRLMTMAAVMALAAVSGEAQERFVPIEGLTLSGPAQPTEAQTLACRHLVREVERITGQHLTETWGAAEAGKNVLLTGNLSDLAEPAAQGKWVSKAGVDDPDVLNQSYALDLVAADDGRTTLIAAGLGTEKTPRGYLGLGYALGELLRVLDKRDGRWGFVLPEDAVVRTPQVKNRTLYFMNSDNCSPGLSLEYFDRAQLEGYVDFLVDARYSRINLWQWATLYLYPGNAEERRPRNEAIHKVMRDLFGYARRRGLEVYHALTPVHVNAALLPDDPKYFGTGYYGRSGVCWSQPEGRELARAMARHEMEYYGPVDGYIVWFYDPGGCFCGECKPNQAKNIFEQLTMVEELAKTISPGAEFQAVLWPTWCWHQYQDQGIPFTKDEADGMVKEFLGRALEHFGPRNLTILDTCEADNSNIYNGLVKPEEFQRCAFMYSVLGMASEHAYPFAPLKFGYLNEKMGLARDRGLEDGNLFIQYAATNRPGVFTFADSLYSGPGTTDARIRAYASTIAKGESLEPAVDVLTALETAGEIGQYADRDAALKEAEAAWSRLDGAKDFHGDKDWLKGYVLAQRNYLELARAADDAAFQTRYDQFKRELGAIPMYREYMEKAMTPQLCVNLHLKAYWRGPGQDYRMVGLPEGQ